MFLSFSQQCTSNRFVDNIFVYVLVYRSAVAIGMDGVVKFTQTWFNGPILTDFVLNGGMDSVISVDDVLLSTTGRSKE